MKTILTIAALAAAGLAAPVSAQVAAPTEVRAVRLAGLDLNDPAHVAKFDRRIGRAARAACRVSDPFDITSKRQRKACVARAVAEATPRRDAVVAAAAARPITRTASR